MEAADASPLEVSPRAAGRWRRTSSRPWSRSSSIGRSGSSSGGSGSIEYTSLRDVLEEEQCGGGGAGGGGCGEHQHHHQQQSWRWGSSWGEYSCHDIHDFDASNIGIRNQLLKHAASAYLQSAVVVAAGRDQGCCLARLWRQAQLRVGCAGGWRGFVYSSAHARGRAASTTPPRSWRAAHSTSPRSSPTASAPSGRGSFGSASICGIPCRV